MLDRLFFPLMGLLAVMIIALALVWPQGIGARSPGPFGHTPVQQTPEMQAAMKRQTEASQKRINQARETMRNLQTEAIAPSQ
ncbi:MAG: hypothetical protein Q7V15_00605 [Phenylobacterium sp.]|uniref:hypothetical protein n=1 Tax=Phenylobacterium sp. TaxID=1871053 RepID=UPI00272827C4|nr:hypothetical protein [Phenylobacterium sp.]MDO8899835.1 hypothetical protein [Phenylobacterium sp.]MDP2213263.1 hypothetical protein [Phenylobacterium sp.]